MFETLFDYTARAGQAHSPSIVLRDGGFWLIWFEGSREAQADVDIAHARFVRGGSGWEASEPEPLVTRDALGAALEPRQLVVTLGNTIQNDAARDALFATVVSVGGWAMAAIADLRLRHGRPAWARKLNLSPVFNRSCLVKSPMVAYSDGSHALPAYFEMGTMHGLLVRLDETGRVRDARRMPGRGYRPIQPMVVPLDTRRALAFLRDFGTGGELLISRTGDGGQSWSHAVPCGIPNPGAPVAALTLADGSLLMAANDEAARGDILRLIRSRDEGRTWQCVETLEAGRDDPGDSVRYPVMRRLETGGILLTYSHSAKGGVRAHLFNDSWVAAR